MVVIGLFGSLNIEITARGEFLENLSGEKKFSLFSCILLTFVGHKRLSAVSRLKEPSAQVSISW